MNLKFFSSLTLLVLAVNGAPKPDPKAGPKPNPMMMRSQPMTIVFPGGQIRGNGMVIDNYGNDYSGNSGFGNNGGFGGKPGLSDLFGNIGRKPVSGNMGLSGTFSKAW